MENRDSYSNVDFLRNILTNYEINTPDHINEIIATGQTAIDQLSKLWKLKTSPPTLRLIDGDELEAYSTGSELIISTGSLKTAFQAQRLLTTSQEADLYGALFEYPLGVSRYFILWIITHEMAHYCRNHQLAIQKFPDSYHALEYDADCLACLVLFEYFTNLLNDGKNGDNILLAKRITLTIIYWQIRNIVDLNELHDSETHPHWIIRVTYFIFKISTLGVGMNKINRDSAQFLESIRPHNRYLMKIIIDAEAMFCEVSGQHPILFIETIGEIFKMSEGGTLRNLLMQWEAIEDFVEENQLCDIQTSVDFTAAQVLDERA